MQPTRYERQFSFTSFSASNPSDQQPGANLDAEFNGVKTTLDATLDNLAKIQRDDGALANDSVTLDQLDPASVLALGKPWNARGTWLTGTAYAINDVIILTGASYVCLVAHTSGVFATDIAAGKWITLYNPAGGGGGGGGIADGSVTSAKLADGAVTTSKIGFTSLSLAGVGNFGGGIAGGNAGAAPPYAIAGAYATGSVYAFLGRFSKAQGAVGVLLYGGSDGNNWNIQQSPNSNDLDLYNFPLGFTTKFKATGGVDFSYAGRFMGADNPTSGAGVEVRYFASVGYVLAFDRTAAVYKPLQILGSSVTIGVNNVPIAVATGTGMDFIGLSINGIKAGYLGIPLNTQNGNYTFQPSDCGKTLYSQNVGATTYTLDTNANQPIPIDDGAILVINDGTTNISIAPAGGVTLILAGAGTTGTRTLKPFGMATIKKVGTNRLYIGGPGLI